MVVDQIRFNKSNFLLLKASVHESSEHLTVKVTMRLCKQLKHYYCLSFLIIFISYYSITSIIGMVQNLNIYASKEKLTTKKPNLQCLFVIAMDYPKYVSHSFLVYFGPISVHFSSNQERCSFLSCSQYIGRLPDCHSNCHVTSGIRIHPKIPKIQEETPQLRIVSSSYETKNCRGD